MKYRNVKLRVLSPEHSAAFQEAVFESGGAWMDRDKLVKHTSGPFLIVEDGMMWRTRSIHYFDYVKSRQIHFITPAYKMTKIRIHSPEHSEFVQRKLFENGCSWMGGFTEAQYTDKPCLTVSETGEIRFCTASFFDEQAYLKEIFIEDDSARAQLVAVTLMSLCPQCGNKRCPKASNFGYKCTGTNDVEQPEKQLDDAMPSASIISVGRPETGSSAGEAAFKLSPSTSYRSALFKGADGYEQLTHVLLCAHNQAARGKGDERHANGQPFHEQRMQSISELIRSPKGMEFQAIKKLTEGMQFDDAERREAELLGAINYIAGIVIYYRNGGK